MGDDEKLARLLRLYRVAILLGVVLALTGVAAILVGAFELGLFGIGLGLFAVIDRALFFRRLARAEKSHHLRR